MIPWRKLIEHNKIVFGKWNQKSHITQKVTNSKIKLKKQHYPQNSSLPCSPGLTCLYCLYKNFPTLHAYRSQVIKFVYQNKKKISLYQNSFDSVNGWKMEPLGGGEKTLPLRFAHKNLGIELPLITDQDRPHIRWPLVCHNFWLTTYYMCVYFGGFFFTISLSLPFFLVLWKKILFCPCRGRNTDSLLSTCS